MTFYLLQFTFEINKTIILCTMVWNRFLHEKREALDAIELLKMFASHKGISIEIATEEDTGNVLNIFF